LIRPKTQSDVVDRVGYGGDELSSTLSSTGSGLEPSRTPSLSFSLYKNTEMGLLGEEFFLSTSTDKT
jgi:hypothetical protein